METYYRLSVEQIEEAYKKIDPVFLRTPQFIHETLSELLNIRLVLKVETLNPIRSFKGRGADFLVSQANEQIPIVCASAGNFGQAMAYSCRKKKMRLTVYAGTKANPFKVARMKSLGANVILHGDDFDTAKLEAKRAAIELKSRFVEDSLDIETLAGAGTIGLELQKFSQPIDVLLIPLGNGALLNGVARIFKERSPATKIVAIQASGAPAMIESWRSGKLVEYKQANTIADGIAVRIPVPQALKDMKGLVDDAVLVKEESILQAMKLLHTHTGMVVEPSGAVGVAALLEQPEKFKGKTIGTIICGSNLTEEQMKLWLT